MKLYIKYFKTYLLHGLVFFIIIAGLIFGCEGNRKSFCRLGCACEPNVNKSPISSNLVDFTDPPSGDIIAPDKVKEVRFYFLKEINTGSFSLTDDIISVDEDGNPGLSFSGISWSAQSQPYVPNAILTLYVNSSSVGVDKCYYITLRGGSIISIDGTVLKNDVVVSIKVRQPDNSYPVFSSYPFAPTWWGQYKFLSPHQPLRFRFNEPMGAISLFVEPSEGVKIDPILEVHDTGVDNMGVLIYRTNQEFPLNANYEITFLSEDMTLKQRNGLPATQDVSGNPLGSPGLLCLVFPQLPGICGTPLLSNKPRSYPFRFKTSHIKFLSPLMDYMSDAPWSGYSPVNARVLTTNDVEKVVLESNTGERPVEITGFTQTNEGRIFGGIFYFKQPGLRTLYAKAYSAGVFKGSDYVKVNIISPPPEYWLTLEINEDAIEAAMGLYPWFPGGETIFGFTLPFGCYDNKKRIFPESYHLLANKSIYQFEYVLEGDIRKNYDLYLLDDDVRKGYFATPCGEEDELIDISGIQIELNNNYTIILPVIKPTLPPPPPDVDCWAEENIWSCRPECLRCVDGHEPVEPPEFMHPPVPAIWKGIGKKIHITLRIKEINIECGYANRYFLGGQACYEELAYAGSRIEGLVIDFDLVPVLLISQDVNCICDDEDDEYYCSPPQKILGPPYRPFLIIRNFNIGDVGNVEMPCIADWIVEEFVVEKIPKFKYEDSYQIDLQLTSEWGKYYFTGGIFVEEEYIPQHKIKVYFEYLPGLQDN